MEYVETGVMHAISRKQFDDVKHKGPCPANQEGALCEGKLELAYYNYDRAPSKTVLEYKCDSPLGSHTITTYPRGRGS